MKKIVIEDLEINPNVKNDYITSFILKGQKMDISIYPDDVELETAIEVANKLVGNLEFYDKKARDLITREQLDNFNNNWRNIEEGELELDEYGFNSNLTLVKISIMSNTSIEFSYTENGLFGNHLLVAQAFDGENFENVMMYG